MSLSIVSSRAEQAVTWPPYIYCVVFDETINQGIAFSTEMSRVFGLKKNRHTPPLSLRLGSERDLNYVLNMYLYCYSKNRSIPESVERNNEYNKGSNIYNTRTKRLVFRTANTANCVNFIVSPKSSWNLNPFLPYYFV